MIFTDTVAVSTFEYGLFLVEMDLASIKAEKESPKVFGEQHRFRKTVYGTNFADCPALVERREC